MKIHPSTIKVAFAVAIGLISGVSASAQDKARIEKSGIILPGTEISREDQKAMNKILKEYDKSLYRINTYEKGQLKRIQGTLSDVIIGKKLVSEIATKARKKGFTQYAIRIGVPEGVGHHPSPTPGATTGVGHGPSPTPGMTIGVGHVSPTPGLSTYPHVAPAQTEGGNDSEELVKRLKPIFEKYSKK